MKLKASFRKVILLTTAIVVVFSCSDSGDHRDTTYKSLGEPDEIISQSYSTFNNETWIYAQWDINRIYIFQKSASGCGGSGEWYLQSRYEANHPYYGGYDLHDPPPQILHEPIESAGQGINITITATITLSKKQKFDVAIMGANLHYRTTGDSLFSSATMSTVSIEDSLYSATIPAENITAEGVEYYIEATSDQSSWGIWGRLPEAEDDLYLIAVSDDLTGKIKKAGYIDSNKNNPNKYLLPESYTVPGRFAPLSP